MNAALDDGIDDLLVELAGSQRKRGQYVSELVRIAWAARETQDQPVDVQALALGLDIKHNGYNVFVTGFSGTGRTTTIRRLLKEIARLAPRALAELDGVLGFRTSGMRSEGPQIVTFIEALYAKAVDEQS